MSDGFVQKTVRRVRSLYAVQPDAGPKMPDVYDAVIVGGGPAGLSAALTLARQLHTCVVFDSGNYRNGDASWIPGSYERNDAPWMHTVLTWDHKAPAEFRAAARRNITSQYDTVNFRDVAVQFIKQNDRGQFEVIDAQGNTTLSKKLILATGVRDILPNIPGYEFCWVKGIFHCFFCHGYEERHSESSGILAIGDLANPMIALHFARNARQITPSKVTIYTNGDDAVQQQIDDAIAAGDPAVPSHMHTDNRQISRLEKGPKDADVILHFIDGTSVTEGFLGHKPKTQLKGEFVRQLHLELTPGGDVQAPQPFMQTSMRGVFAAGDMAGPLKVANHALFSGAGAAAAVAAQLQADVLGQKPMF